MGFTDNAGKGVPDGGDSRHRGTGPWHSWMDLHTGRLVWQVWLEATREVSGLGEAAKDLGDEAK